MLGSWSATSRAVQTLDSLQLGFFPPQGTRRRRDQGGDNSTGQVRVAISTRDEGSKVPGALRCRVLGCCEPAPGTWSRLEHLTFSWGLIFLCKILFAASPVLRLPVLQSAEANCGAAPVREPALAGQGGELAGQGGELAGCDQHGTAQLGSAIPVHHKATWAGWCGQRGLGCHRPQLGCARSGPAAQQGLAELRAGEQLLEDLDSEKSKSSPGVRATKAPAWTGRGLGTQPALGSSALSLPKLSKLPSSEAVCLQLDRLPRLSTLLPHSRCWVEQEQSGASSGSG